MIKEQKKTYQLVPQEGGWGYVITAALTVACTVTVIPMTCFGIIFGGFLANIGDETAGTTLSNGMFLSVFNFTGLIASFLLKMYSFRTVGLVGAFLFAIGAFSTIFVQNLFQMITSYGFIQGVGMGLLFPALFTALNSYFDKKLTLMNNIAQCFMVLASMIYPIIGNYLMSVFGFRGTVAIVAALSFNSILAAITLQPVEWHLKKEEVKEHELQAPLLEEGKAGGVVIVSAKPRMSIISVGDRALSVSTINKAGLADAKQPGIWQSFDLSLFKDLSYINLALGLSFGFSGDVAFIPILPLILGNAGFAPSEVAFLLMVHFSADFVGRIVLSTLSAMFKINNKMIFMVTAFLVSITRTAFVLRNDYMWKMVTISMLGFLRGYIHSPLPCVISDQYATNFSTAFSLYMVVCGFVNLVFGPVMTLVKSYTHSDVMVVHFLSLTYLTCALTWSFEMIYKKLTRKK